MSGRTVREAIGSAIAGTGVSDERLIAAGSRIAKALGIDPDLDLDTHALIAVPADTARLLTPEVLAALPALLRVAANRWETHQHRPNCPSDLRVIDPATWEALGAALEAHDA